MSGGHAHPANRARHDERTFADRVADRLAAFVGSWTFVIGQAVVLVLWVVVNTLTAFRVIRFDPFPFVFMNLFMSAEAAFATPVILMSQNRQTEHDRTRAEHDYEVNETALAEITRNTEVTEQVRDLLVELREAKHDG